VGAVGGAGRRCHARAWSSSWPLLGAGYGLAGYPESRCINAQHLHLVLANFEDQLVFIAGTADLTELAIVCERGRDLCIRVIEELAKLRLDAAS